MKRLLSFLLCIVFLQAQTACLYAKRGGPDIGGSGPTELTGTYSGVLIPTDPTEKQTKALDGEVINAMGIFSLSAPRVGPATGAFLLFAEGVIFNGTITAVGDPGKGEFNGVVDATYNATIFVGDENGNLVLDPMTNQPVTTDVEQQVVGSIKCEVTKSNVVSTFNPLALLASQRLEGKAEMGTVVVTAQGFALDTVDTYEVDGVLQSPEVAPAGAGDAEALFVF